MLQANKASVLTGFHMGSMKVQYMEVEYLIMVMNKTTSLASLLSGFAASTFLQSTGLQKGESWIKLIYVLFTSSAVGFMLLVLLICTLCTMWGPGLALRGPKDESLQRAVDIMDSSVQAAFRLFSIGLACYLFSSILSMVLLQPSLSSLVSVAIISVGGVFICRAGFHVVEHLSPSYVTPATIRGDPLFSAARAEGEKTAGVGGFVSALPAWPHVKLGECDTGYRCPPSPSLLRDRDFDDSPGLDISNLHLGRPSANVPALQSRVGNRLYGGGEGGTNRGLNLSPSLCHS
ncbi:conserved hypothetical protein [Neospora caninum Liverpool]|uniref:Transmembrane protein n=1 Tax=Neospora caninum (strain Liverpool) TaxID=572307 RepID=F0VDY6_NEOCL|nr:conserved hypothetical protein [Neospora caninum Liverpool]CBZ51929.1 conserved hypothetical protein [Neospora caninum Liverpool]CEL65891.1 TPA: hypothetical protein BN1204_017210 [Neospora caninum Liverpool]|eukprot:XP_003881962.1 conserved hypothetical protein [Neospora caninum Liverpool]